MTGHTDDLQALADRLESKPAGRPGPGTELYYLQDSRTFVGNDVMFWAAAGGYTTDVSKAEVFEKAKAIAMHESRATDIPWPKAYIDGKTRPAVDMQYIKRDEALAGTGIVLAKPQRLRESPLKCHSCGKFVPAAGYMDCTHCGADNRP